jgi:hypothetical protein
MPGLVPGNPRLESGRTKDVDGRDKPGHDDAAVLKVYILALVGYCVAARS